MKGKALLFRMHGAPWSNTAIGLPSEKDSPIFTKLFRDYAIFCGHLSIPVPFPGTQVGLAPSGSNGGRRWRLKWIRASLPRRGGRLVWGKKFPFRRMLRFLAIHRIYGVKISLSLCPPREEHPINPTL